MVVVVFLVFSKKIYIGEFDSFNCCCNCLLAFGNVVVVEVSAAIVVEVAVVVVVVVAVVTIIVATVVVVVAVVD